MRPVGVVTSNKPLSGSRYLIASMVLWAISNALPAVRFIEEPITANPAYQTMFGWEFTILGWLGPLSGQFGWYANPLMLLALCSCLARWRRTAQVLATLGALAAMSSLALIVMGLPKNEGGVGHLGFSAFLPGYYLWAAAHVSGWIGSMRGLPPEAPPVV